MTKLEQKLQELGYEIDSAEYLHNKLISKILFKSFEFCSIEARVHSSYALSIFTAIEPINLKIKYEYDGFRKQEVIDNLQQAFNEMQKDLEELKKYEDKNI